MSGITWVNLGWMLGIELTNFKWFVKKPRCQRPQAGLHKLPDSYNYACNVHVNSIAHAQKFVHSIDFSE